MEMKGKWRPLLRGAVRNMIHAKSHCICLCVWVVFQPSECEQCTCDNDGIARCLVADCAPPPCVNPIYQPGKCCPECKDGKSNIISKGRKLNNKTERINRRLFFSVA